MVSQYHTLIIHIYTMSTLATPCCSDAFVVAEVGALEIRNLELSEQVKIYFNMAFNTTHHMEILVTRATNILKTVTKRLTRLRIATSCQTNGTCEDGLSPGRTAVSVVSHRWAAHFFLLLNPTRIANSYRRTRSHAAQAERIDHQIGLANSAM
jgi:hypothetical protein